jgi:O-antigen ligase
MFSISITQIAFALGAVAWLVKVQLTQSWGRVNLPVGIPFLAFLVACLVAVVLAVDPGHSYKSLKKLLQIIVFFWAVNSIEDGKQRDFLVALLIVSGLVAGLYGFYQSLVREVSISSRVEGTLSTYMTFAGVLMVVGLLGLGRFVFRSKREYWVGGAVVVISICLLLTLTRQAWVGYFVGIIFLIGFWKPKYLSVIPVLLVLVILFSPPAIKNRIYSMVDLNNWTFQTRLALWRGGWEIFKDYPVTGCGFKCVDIVLSNYPDPTGYIKKYKGMHNNIVQIAVDTGILGLLAWVSIWVCYFMEVYRRSPGGEPDSRSVYLGSAAAVLGFLAGGMFEVNFYDSEVVMLLYFIMALPLVPSKKAKTAEAASVANH